MATHFGVASNLTDIQKKASWLKHEVEGSHFRWELQVQSVDTTFGQIQAQFKCRESNAFVSDVILRVSDETTALQLEKDRFYKVHGTLRDYGSLIGLSGALVAIE